MPFPFTILLGILLFLTCVWCPVSWIPSFTPPPFYNFLYLWSISFSHLEYEGYIFLRPTCQKMSLPALQVTILDVLGYSLELYSHLVTPSFQPQHEPSHLTLLISSLVLGHPCGWWKLGECASLEEHLSFLGSPTFRSYHGCWWLVYGCQRELEWDNSYSCKSRLYSGIPAIEDKRLWYRTGFNSGYNKEKWRFTVKD